MVPWYVLVKAYTSDEPVGRAVTVRIRWPLPSMTSSWKIGCSRDTVIPSFTSAAACFRLPGVIKFAAPSSSSCPHRPQFDRSFIAWWNSASVVIVLRAVGAVWAAEPHSRRTVAGALTKPLTRTLLACVISSSAKHSAPLDAIPRTDSVGEVVRGYARAIPQRAR